MEIGPEGDPIEVPIPVHPDEVPAGTAETGQRRHAVERVVPAPEPAAPAEVPA